MLKVFGIISVTLLVFLSAIIVPMALTGNLNQEAFSRLMGREEIPLPDKEADLGQLASDLVAERQRLVEWEEDLNLEAGRLDQREQAIDQTLTEMAELQTQISSAMDQLDEEQAAAITIVAESLAEMDAANAAEDLEDMSPEEAARILPLIKKRSRGEILDAMDAGKRSLILRVTQERKY